MKKKIIIVLAGILVLTPSVKADPQGTAYRHEVDKANYLATRADYESRLMKQRAKLAKKAQIRSKRNLRAYRAWSSADAGLFNHEQAIYKYGIDSPSYSWDLREYGSVNARFK